MKYIDPFLAGFKLGINDFRGLWTLRSWLGGWMLRMICNIVVWIYLGELVGSAEKFQYILIGNCATAGLGNFAVVVPSWERTGGTFGLLLAAPTPVWLPILGRMTVWALSWYATAILCFGLSVGVLGSPKLEIGFVPIGMIIIALLCVSTLMFSAFLGAIVSARPNLRLIVGWGLLTSIMAFTGVTTPISIWPNYVQQVLQVLPVTNGLEALRITLAEGMTSSVLYLCSKELCIAGLWGLLSIFAFSLSARTVRNNGKIDFSD